MTAYHARYYACLLTKRAAPDMAERYLPALMSANIDIHPHQIDAAVFACRSQYKDGVILADEEGLGKTIEGGIALLQASVEGKKNPLVLCNTPLISHWEQELLTKVFIRHNCFTRWWGGMSDPLPLSSHVFGHVRIT